MRGAKQQIITALRETKGPVSGAYLASQLGVSGTAVWKQIQNLRKFGYVIHGSTRLGYTLKKETKQLVAEEVAYGLKTKLIGHNIVYSDRVDSTNVQAKVLMRRGKVGHGSVVLAEEQTGGRGRLGRSWVSPKNGMWFTIVLNPNIRLSEIPSFTLVVSEAVVRTLQKYGGSDIKIKWPNDIVFKGKKLAGILCEIEAEQDVVNTIYVGIGINVNCSRTSFPAPIRNMIVTMKEITSIVLDRRDLMRELLQNIEENYDRLLLGDLDQIVKNWRRNCETLGKDVVITDLGRTFEGKAIDIDPTGALILQVDKGKRELIRSGDVIRKKTKKV